MLTSVSWIINLLTALFASQWWPLASQCSHQPIWEGGFCGGLSLFPSRFTRDIHIYRIIFFVFKGCASRVAPQSLPNEHSAACSMLRHPASIFSPFILYSIYLFFQSVATGRKANTKCPVVSKRSLIVKLHTWQTDVAIPKVCALATRIWPTAAW